MRHVEEVSRPRSLDSGTNPAAPREANTGTIRHAHPSAQEYRLAMGSRLLAAGCREGQKACRTRQEREISSRLETRWFSRTSRRHRRRIQNSGEAIQIANAPKSKRLTATTMPLYVTNTHPLVWYSTEKAVTAYHQGRGDHSFENCGYNLVSE